METKEAIVIDSKGFKVEFVIATVTEIGEEVHTTPLYYTLQEGESLIFEDISAAIGMLKPQWGGTQWIECATKEEIEASKPPVLEQTQPLNANDNIITQIKKCTKRLTSFLFEKRNQ